MKEKELRRSLAVFPIGSVMKLTDLTARQIRYYEDQGLISPDRTEGNRRMYSLDDMDRLLEIKDYISDGLNIADIKNDETPVMGAYGKMEEVSTGKDTTSGHWEMMGHPVTVPFPTFYDGFPKELMDTFTKETGYGYLGNEVASGTEIIERLGVEQHENGETYCVYLCRLGVSNCSTRGCDPARGFVSYV